MKQGAAVKLVKAGQGGLQVTFEDGTSRLLQAGERAWLPLSARLQGHYTIVINRAEKPIETK